MDLTETLPKPAPLKKAVRRIIRFSDISPEDYSCEQFFDLLDAYVEVVEQGEDIDGLIPFMRRHLELCPSCEDEYEALMNILRKQSE